MSCCFYHTALGVEHTKGGCRALRVDDQNAVEVTPRGHAA